jgi:hypothetical protein
MQTPSNSRLRAARLSHGVSGRETRTLQVLLRLPVERLRGHVGTVRPGNRAGLVVDSNEREVGRIVKRREYSAPLSSREVGIANGAVREGQAEAEAVEHLDCGDVDERFHLSDAR